MLIVASKTSYSLEYKDSLEKGEVYKAKIFHAFVKGKTILQQNHQNNQKKKNHSSNYH